MYYPDLARLTLDFRQYGDPVSVAVGWLDKSHPYTTGDVSEVFVDRLWAFCRFKINGLWEYHRCEHCDSPITGLRLQRGNEVLSLGSAEIRVWGKDNVIYCVPNLIYHYVVDHQYCPPHEFTEAVLECPLPGTTEYETLAKIHRWK